MEDKFNVKVDRTFALKLLDRMIGWDNSVVRPRIAVVDDEELRVLYDAYDFFFWLVLKAKSEEIDHLAPIFKELCQRVSGKHRDLFYEGFFHALSHMLMLRKMMLKSGEDAWFSFWNESFQASLVKLGM